ncbi:T9SS type A sorting domain-containing protein, partial [Pedobacter sp.]
ANISFTAGTYQHAKLIDINGTILKQAALEKSNQTISFDLTNYPKGIYFIKLSGHKENSTQKIIKH